MSPLVNYVSSSELCSPLCMHFQGGRANSYTGIAIYGCYHLMLFLAEIETQSVQHPSSHCNHENYKLTTSSAWCTKACTIGMGSPILPKVYGDEISISICCYGTDRAITSVVLQNLSKVTMHKLHQDKVMT